MIEFLRNLFKDPKAAFIYGILSKWYIVMMGAGVAAAYFFLKGIDDIGLLSSMQQLIFGKAYMAVEIAKDCTPKILNMQEFMRCVGNH